MIFKPISENVSAITGPPAYANVTALALPKRVVMVDCGIQLPAVAETRREIEGLSRTKVEMVVLTHFHSDHTRALPAFSDCRIISPNLLLKNLELAGRKPPKGYELTLPNETFADKLEIHYTPKHGSWLNIAEIELSVLSKQCLARRIPDIETLIKEVAAWQKARSNNPKQINWRFTTEDARIKLKKLYPSI